LQPLDRYLVFSWDNAANNRSYGSLTLQHCEQTTRLLPCVLALPATHLSSGKHAGSNSSTPVFDVR
jgi:hypothetical protein